jgi:hypothetical protein
MAQSNSRRTPAALALAAALLFLPAARAFELPGLHRTEIRVSAVPDLVSTLWDALARLWSKEGGGLDPHGGTQSVDAGSGLDPHGRTSAATGEEGSGLDPHGQP